MKNENFKTFNKPKFNKKNGNDKNNSIKIETKSSRKIKCYECQGMGHIAIDCLNRLKKKEKVMQVTWHDSDESDQSDDKEDSGNYMAFVTSVDCPWPSKLKGNDSVFVNANSDVHEDVPSNLHSNFDPIVNH